MAGLHVDIILFYTMSVLILSISANTVDATFQDELLKRIQSLEKQGREQAETMRQMELRLDEQNERLISQEKSIKQYKDMMRELEPTVAELQVRKDSDVSEDSADRKEVGNEEFGINRQERSMKSAAGQESTKQRRVLVNGEGPVAFHAVIKSVSEIDQIGKNQKIVFPDALINLGGGYHNLHGIFIAPKPGIYIFSTSVMSFPTGHVEIYVHLMKNGQILANAYAHGASGHYDQGSVTVVTQLAVGDEVWVSLYGPVGTSMYGNYYDSFMGCLVVPM